MSKNEENGKPVQGVPSVDEKGQASDGRRDALKKTITVGGVSVALSGWTKPVVESVVLPAHAQTTGGFAVGFILNL